MEERVPDGSTGQGNDAYSFLGGWTPLSNSTIRLARKSQVERFVQFMPSENSAVLLSGLTKATSVT
jgi:hypothetical protein